MEPRTYGMPHLCFDHYSNPTSPSPSPQYGEWECDFPSFILRICIYFDILSDTIRCAVDNIRLVPSAHLGPNEGVHQLQHRSWVERPSMLRPFRVVKLADRCILLILEMINKHKA